jgi:hypothetical protein
MGPSALSVRPGDVDDELSVDRGGQRLAHPDVVHRGRRRVDHEQRLVAGRLPDPHVDRVVVEEIDDVEVVRADVQVEVAGLEGLASHRGVGDELELDRIEVRTLAPVVLVAHDPGAVAGRP